MGKKKEVATLLTTLDKTTLDSLTEEEKALVIEKINEARKEKLLGPFVAYKIIIHTSRKNFSFVHASGIPNDISIELVNMYKNGRGYFTSDASEDYFPLKVYPDSYSDAPDDDPLFRIYIDAVDYALFVRKESMTDKLIERIADGINAIRAQTINKVKQKLNYYLKENETQIKDIKHDLKIVNGYSSEMTAVDALKSLISEKEETK